MAKQYPSFDCYRYSSTRCFSSFIISFALPQLNIPIRGKIKIILMFSFYVLLDLINFLTKYCINVNFALSYYAIFIIYTFRDRKYFQRTLLIYQSLLENEHTSLLLCSRKVFLVFIRNFRLYF
jgi:hypothetical protein